MRIETARRRAFVCLTTFCLTAVFLWAQTLGFNVFELDGNAVDDPTGLPTDWGALKPLEGNLPALQAVLPGLEAYNHEAEPSMNSTIFTGGGSKDIQDVSEWAWKDGAGGLPDKDNLLNASAASVKIGGDRVIYMHADRFANDGSAEMAFWVFQNPVSLGTNRIGGGTGFNGVHANGDVFVRATFTNGGAEVSISVDLWQNGGLVNEFDSSVAKCDGTNTVACGISNAGAVASPWPYQGKNYPTANEFPTFSFFEVAINISEIFRNAGISEPPCFASFLAETRSSHETTAQLKDFVLGSFDVCSVSITKACQCTGFDASGPNPTNNTGYNYGFNGTVTANGGTLYNVTVTDKGKTYDCGTVSPTQPKGFGGAVAVATPTTTTCAGPAGTFTDDEYPTNNQASVTATTSPSGGSNLSAQTASVSCSTEATTGACTPNPQLTVDKQCVTALEVEGSYVVVRVDYTGKVYNNGNVNLTNVQVTETHDSTVTTAPTFSVGTLNASSSKCYTNGQDNCPVLTLPSYNASPISGVASYFPNGGTGVSEGRVQFSDKVRATAVNPFGGGPVESHPAGGGYSASCRVCPFGACPLTQ
jgi:hypothetical protein